MVIAVGDIVSPSVQPGSARKRLAGDWRVRTPQICESDVERGDLVAENM